MNSQLSGVILATAVAAGLAMAGCAPRAAVPATGIAVAGSPLIVPGNFDTGILRKVDTAGGEIVVGTETYRLYSDTKLSNRNLTVGDDVTVTWHWEHYGRAARKVATGVRRNGTPEPNNCLFLQACPTPE